MIPKYEGAAVMAMPRPAPRIHAVPAPKPSLIRFVDALEVAVSLAGRDGRLTVMNAPARDLFIGRAGGQLRGAVESAVRLAMTHRRTSGEGFSNPARQFEIEHDRYHVTIVVAGADVAGQDIGAMVMLRRESIASAPQATEECLARRFGLTPQESRVALLLAEQRSNKDIADRLGVSVHTARHHTERVLAKLEVHSRHDVKRALS